MSNISYKRLKGGQNLRQRLLLATLSATNLLIVDIRVEDTLPGLRPHEISLLRLLERISDDCVIRINETGITNDSNDPSVDTFRSTTLPMLKHFGVPSEGLGLKIESRGAPPRGRGGGEAVNWTDEGMVKRIRGITFSTKVSPQFVNAMIHAARGIFNRLLPDVYIFTDHRAGPQAGNSPGYGILLVAETNSGCFISVDAAISYPHRTSEMDNEKNELMPPEDVGEQMASLLLQEIELGGVVDSTHQGLLFILCSICPPDVSKVRVGKLSPYGIETLREIREFVGVKFVIKPEPSTGTVTVTLKCVGCGLKNLSRKVS